MNIKVKTTLILLTTFIIGMAAGAMITHAFIKYRMKKVLSMRAPEGFANHFEHIINPTPKQREAVRNILIKYGKKLAEEGEKIREQFLSVHEALNKELYAILTPEQKKRLDERFFGPEHGDFFRRKGEGPPAPPWMGDFHGKDGKPPTPPWGKGDIGPDGNGHRPPWPMEPPHHEKEQHEVQSSKTNDKKNE